MDDLDYEWGHHVDPEDEDRYDDADTKDYDD